MNESPKILGYFVCVDGFIWTVYQTGNKYHSNYPYTVGVEVKNNTVQVLSAASNGWHLINDKYRLWTSIVDLAIAIEKPTEEA